MIRGNPSARENSGAFIFIGLPIHSDDRTK